MILPSSTTSRQVHRDVQDALAAGGAAALVAEPLVAALQKREDRLLDVKEISRRTTLSRTRIHVLERAGGFPKRRKVSGNKVANTGTPTAQEVARAKALHGRA